MWGIPFIETERMKASERERERTTNAVPTSCEQSLEKETVHFIMFLTGNRERDAAAAAAAVVPHLFSVS